MLATEPLLLGLSLHAEPGALHHLLVVDLALELGVGHWVSHAAAADKSRGRLHIKHVVIKLPTLA